MAASGEQDYFFLFKFVTEETVIKKQKQPPEVFCKMFLEISRDLQENICARVPSLIKLQASVTLPKKRLWYRCFPVNFAKFLRTPYRTPQDDCFLRRLISINNLNQRKTC